MPRDLRGTVAVAMSGGVDSSVAAALLAAEGRKLIGVTMRLWHSPMAEGADNLCCSVEAVDSARQVARTLGFDHIVLNMSDAFHDTVVSDFIVQYGRGLTPNPCIVCNQRVKFGELHRRLLALGVDAVATGHYVRRRLDSTTGRWTLARPSDLGKDQSYVLYRLSQDQIAYSLFPLGDMTKSQVRDVARSIGLRVADRPDSQEVCFVPPGMYREFLALEDPALGSPGPIVDVDGRVIGAHRGLAMYTVGQRKGLGALGPRPMYVLEIRPDTNTIVVGPEDLLYRRTLLARQLNFMPFATLDHEMTVEAKIRYKSASASARIRPAGPDTVAVDFDEPQRAITPGQSVVFYSGDTLVGGGVIAASDARRAAEM